VRAIYTPPIAKQLPSEEVKEPEQNAFTMQFIDPDRLVESKPLTPETLPHAPNWTIDGVAENAQADFTQMWDDDCTELDLELAEDLAPILAKLTRASTSECIEFKKPEFKIGRKSEHTDFAIQDNTKISAVHALFSENDSSWGVEDLNSTNHIRINDMKISPGQRYEIHSGDVIKLADEEFYFEVQ
jgi:hypothetical protein